MSDTPRTDKEQGMASEWLHSDMVVPAGFARLLERESRKYKNIARETLDQMGRDTESAIKSADEMELLKKQLNAANAKIVELQGQLIANAHNQQENYTYGIRG